MTAALQELGFTVEKITNGSLDQMEEAVMRLKNRLSASGDSYGFFFYAGHGVQSGGENYLIPVDANIPGENFLRSRAVSVQTVLDELNDARNRLNVVVLDACRDNPFSWARSGSRGLALVSRQPADSIIVYATSAGSTASDGTGRNGLFTGQLLNNLRTPDLEVNEMFRRTGADVSEVSNRRQIPAVYNQFFGTAYLGGTLDGSVPIASVPRPVQPAPQPVQPSARDTSKDAWKNKWVYLGGGLGGGSFSWSYTDEQWYDNGPWGNYVETNSKTENASLVNAGFVSEFALLPFFSIELMLAIGYGNETVLPVIPILAKLGGRIAQIELSFDLGYTVGLGFTLGGTFGVHAGPGVVFVKYLNVPDPSPPEEIGILNSLFTIFLGYKVGLGDKKPLW